VKIADKKALSGVCVDIYAKDGREFRFTFFPYDKENLGDKICKILKVYAFNEDPRYLFAFAYKREFPVNGWEVYNDIKDWKRMGIDFESKVCQLVKMIGFTVEIVYW
jgi:hypothetical protein